MSIISAESSTPERKFHALNEQKRQLEAVKRLGRQPTLHELFVAPPLDDLRRFSKDLTFLQLEDGLCKYGYGKETPYLFCGNGVQDGSSYCPGHHEICWTPTQRLLPRARKYFGTDLSR